MLIATLGWDPEEQIPVSEEDGDTLTLSDALTRHFEITKLTKPLLQQAAAIFDNDDLSDKVQDNEWVQQYISMVEILLICLMILERMSCYL